LDVASARKKFGQFLNQLEPLKVQIDSMCWFAEDFSRFSSALGEEIVQRLLYPSSQQAKTFEATWVLYSLISAICETCSSVYSIYFAEQLPTLIESSLRRGDEKIGTKLGKLIEHWEQNHFFNETVIGRFKQIHKDSAKVARAPVPVEPEPRFQMYPMEEAPVMVVSRPPVIVEGTESQDDGEERRLYRGWMRTAVDWETPLPRATDLILDADDDGGSRRGKERICYIHVTPENENASCSSCSGMFEKVMGPDGALSYKGVVYVKGSGTYMHQSCQSDHLLSRL
jgi:hypothetical protein